MKVVRSPSTKQIIVVRPSEKRIIPAIPEEPVRAFKATEFIGESIPKKVIITAGAIYIRISFRRISDGHFILPSAPGSVA
jgi:hypothetical protein